MFPLRHFLDLGLALKTRRTCTIYFVAQTIERWLFYHIGFEVPYFDAIFYPFRKPDN